MTADDRERWDRRYTDGEHVVADKSVARCPAGFRPFEADLPVEGGALDVACGAGEGAVWLAERGLNVLGTDVSSIAVDLAVALAVEHEVSDRARFVCSDLDDGLPPGPRVDLITCHLFSAPGLDEAILNRLADGGMLAVTVLSEVGAEPGAYRARPGELLDRFGALRILHHHEGEGTASMLGVVTGPHPPTRLD